MSDEYLWDRSGKPDPELVKLEQELGKYRLGRSPRRLNIRWWIPLALAASLAAVLLWQQQPKPLSRWQMQNQPIALHQTVSIEQETVVQVGSIGRLRFSPGARFRITRSEPNHEHMDLLEGKFDALIIAAPHVFQVNTPPARLDDLGCAYEVSVSQSGSGKVMVTSGWVHVSGGNAESLVRQGYEVVLAKGQAPSIPRPIARVDDSDPLSLLHLIWRSSTPEQRGEAFDKLSNIHPPPPGVTRERAQRGDRSIVRDYWPALNLGPEISLPRVFLN